MSWYSSGYNGLQQEEQRQLQSQRPDHFWMPAGGKKQFVFVDDQPVTIYEHNPKIDGDFKNWTTCLQGCYDDVACCTLMGSDTRYFVGYYTVIDLSEYVDKKGNKHQYGIKLLPAKSKTLKKFQRKQSEKGSLVGAIYQAVREDTKSPNVGDEFEFQRQADLEKLFPLVNYRGKKLSEMFTLAAQDASAMTRLKHTFELKTDDAGALLPVIPKFNYGTLLYPRDSKDIRSWLAGKSIDKDSGFGQTGGGAKGGSADESIPF